jgi:hypothetical protein
MTMERHQSSPSNGAPGHSPHNGNFGARVDQIGSTAQQLISEAKSAVNDLSQTLDIKGRVDRHPYATLAAAAAVGYVLGGGLFTPMTARLLRLGVRLAALPFVKDELMGMAEAAFTGITGSVPGADPDRSRGPQY